MYRRILFVIGLCLTVCLPAALPTAARAGTLHPALERRMDANPDRSPMTVLVFLKERLDIQALDRQLHAAKAPMSVRHRVVVESLREVADGSQGRLLADLQDRAGRGEILDIRPYWIVNAVRVVAAEAVIRDLALHPDVGTIEPAPQAELIAPTARREVTGDRGIGITPGLVNIGVRRVWDELGLRGEGTLIASLDSGVDGAHPALADRWRGNHAPWQECWYDVDGDTTFPVDADGHGTHCTGTMTGLAPGDTIGVAPAARWIAANPINNDGSDLDTDITACFQWFADPDGDPATVDDVPDVVQNSWGVMEALGYPDCDSRWWDAIDACEAAGPVLIFAAGNEGIQGLRSPADRATTDTNCFAVGATEHSLPFTLAGFSSLGPVTGACGPEENLTKPEVSAPGVDIYSAAPGGGYLAMDGTSMATPHVCGVVALMRQANPDADAVTIKRILMGTSEDLGTPGEDNGYGHGIIDAFAAVTQVAAGAGTLAGTVTDGDTGLPLAGAVVRVLDSYGATETDQAGQFTLDCTAGAQIVTVSVYGYEILMQPVEIPVGGTLVADLALAALPRATFSGTVYLPGADSVGGGSPAAGAIITVPGTSEPQITADAQGRYTLTLPVGSDRRLVVSSGIDGYLNQTVPVAGDLELDLYLKEGNAEGFETGDFSNFNWWSAGAEGWSVQDQQTHSGTYAARSGDIADGEYSQFYSFVNCGEGGDFSFWFKLSSESGDDFLRVQIGNDWVGEWSGEWDWTQATFPVPAGTNPIRVRYQKGAAGSAGSDAAWVDDLNFPGPPAAPRLVVAPADLAATSDGSGPVSVTAYLLNMGDEDLTWTVSESAGWLDIAPAEGTVPGGGYTALALAFDPAGLLDGWHSALVTISSSDPANPDYVIEPRLHLDSGVSPADDPPAAPLALAGAVPNPFNPLTTIHFSLAEPGRVQVAVYDLRGHLVRELVQGHRPAGRNDVRWDGRDDAGRPVGSGTYFVRLRAGAEVKVKRMALVR